MGMSLASAWPAALVSEQRRVAVASLVRQAAVVGFSVAVVISPFRARLLLQSRPLPPVFADYTNLLLFWSDVLVLGVFALWAASLVLQPRRVYLGPLAVRLPVVGLFAAAWLSVPFSQDAALAAYNAATLTGFAVLGLYVVNELEDVTRLVPALVVMIVVQALVAIPQVLAQESFGLQLLGELKLNPDIPGTSILWTNHAPRLLRAYGLTQHPNILGGLLTISLLVLASCLVRYREEALSVLCGVFGLGVAALLLTFSRSAGLGLAGGFAVAAILFVARRHWRALRIWVAAALIAALVTLPLVKVYSPYLQARVNPTTQQQGSTEARALTERQALTRITNDVFVRHPLTGVGVGVLPAALRKANPDFAYDYAPAHVVVLTVAAETGIFGALAYSLLMFAPWLLLWLSRARLTPLLIGLTGALAAIQIIGLLDYYTWSLNPGRFWFWLVLGLWVIAYRQTSGTAADA